ncbi:MAG TPA: alpha/beta hydrolase, partial [Steroidobacteraceae bacterium]|nr:alpha/beta hydrolase [Steroidobacteraceae bacterium]
YRLAPEHPFPAAVDDALSATLHIAENAATYGIDGARLGVCGDSAGATLAAATSHAMIRTGRQPLRLQLLLCPILDWSRPTASRRELAHGFLVDQETLDHDLRHYVPAGCGLSDPRISPLCAEDPTGLPVTFIHTAEYDPLRDEGAEYAARLSAAGCQVSLTCHAGMIHLFYGLQSVVPYARRAFEQIGLQIRGTLAHGPSGRQGSRMRYTAEEEIDP